MYQSSFTLENPKGLHARPSALLAQEALNHVCSIIITKNDFTADAKSILDIMQLEALQNDILTVQADGPDEHEAVEAIGRIFRLLYED
ncbi:MAG: HPr family phosphocarrier protein [Fibrobacterales bacterium]